jgi:HPt (histidine-containing phosphotransfer) domain-containing protein
MVREAPAWRADRALDRVGGDRTLLQEIVGLVLSESPALLRRIEIAINEHDADALASAAHSLKGELGYIDAEGAAETARRLEGMGRAHDLAEAQSVLTDLREQLSRLEPELRELAESKA